MANPIAFHIERTNEPAQPYYWYVSRTSGTKLAYSENLTSRANAENAIAAVKAGNVTYETFLSTGRWYFRIKGKNGEIMARSAMNYGSTTAAKADANEIRDNAAGAPGR